MSFKHGILKWKLGVAQSRARRGAKLGFGCPVRLSAAIATAEANLASYQAGTTITVDGTGNTSTELTGRNKAQAEAEQHIKAHMAEAKDDGIVNDPDSKPIEKADLVKRQEAINRTSQRVTKEIKQGSQKQQLDELASKHLRKPGDNRTQSQKNDAEAFKRDMADRADTQAAKRRAADFDRRQTQFQLDQARDVKPI